MVGPWDGVFRHRKSGRGGFPYLEYVPTSSVSILLRLTLQSARTGEPSGELTAKEHAQRGLVKTPLM